MLGKVQREDIKNKRVDPSREKFVVNKTKNANTDARNFRWLTKPQRTREEEGKSFQFDVKRATQERPKRHFVLCLQTHSATSWRQARDWEKSARGVMDELTGKSLKLSSSLELVTCYFWAAASGETCWSTENVTLQRPRRSHSLPRCCCDNNKFRWHEEYASLIRRFRYRPVKRRRCGRQWELGGVWKIWKNVFWIASKWYSIVVVREQRLDLNEIFENFFFEFAKSARICLLDYFICEFQWPTIRIISSLESVFPY